MNVYTLNRDSQWNPKHREGSNGSAALHPKRGNTSSASGTNQSERQEHWLWNRDTVKILGYMAALVPFILVFNLQSLPRLPYPLAGNLLDWQAGVIPQVWQNGAVLTLLLWGIIYCCKTLLIIMRHNCSTCCLNSTTNSDDNVHFQPDTSLSHLAAPLLCFQLFFGVWMGWGNNIHTGYNTSDTEYLIAGCILFVAGQTTYFVTSVMRLSRTPSGRLRALSELADLTAFLGLAVVSFTMPGFTWFLFRLIISGLVLGRLVDPGLF